MKKIAGAIAALALAGCSPSAADREHEATSAIEAAGYTWPRLTGDAPSGCVKFRAMKAHRTWVDGTACPRIIRKWTVHA